jgi:hypothetical protein
MERCAAFYIPRPPRLELITRSDQIMALAIEGPLKNRADTSDGYQARA